MFRRPPHASWECSIAGSRAWRCGGAPRIEEDRVLLALDTSTLTLSMALLERGPPLRLIQQIQHGPPRKQSEMLPQVIGELLLAHGVDLRQLKALVVGL